MEKSLRKARQTDRPLETHGREDERYLTGARATAVVSTGGRNAHALPYVAVLPKENANADRHKDKDKKKKEERQGTLKYVTPLMPKRKKGGRLTPKGRRLEEQVEAMTTSRDVVLPTPPIVMWR